MVRVKRIVAAAVAIALLWLPDHADAGRRLRLTLSAPTPGTTYPTSTFVRVGGLVAKGSLSTPTNVVYVIDTSDPATADKAGPASSDGDCDGDTSVTGSDDVNGDGLVGRVLDCQLAAVSAFHSFIAKRANVATSVVFYGRNASAADVAPSVGIQTSTPSGVDLDGNTVNDVHQVLAGLGSCEAQAFSSIDTGTCDGTDLDDALQATISVMNPSPPTIVMILTHHDETAEIGPGSAMQSVIESGAQVFTYPVGVADGCATGKPVRVIADQTGGNCAPAPDAQDATDLLLASASIPRGVKRVKVVANGLPAVDAAFAPLGVWSTVVTIVDGTNTIKAVATARRTRVVRRVTVYGT